MFACMVGSPPQPADQRKTEDKMAGHFEKLEGQYSPELVQLVRWCLQIDPLERPQSLFALQKVLQAKPPAARNPHRSRNHAGQAARLVGRLGGGGGAARARPVRPRANREASTMQFSVYQESHIGAARSIRTAWATASRAMRCCWCWPTAWAAMRGEVAATVALQTISLLFQQQAQPVKKPQRFLEEALQAAHRDIHRHRQVKAERNAAHHHRRLPGPAQHATWAHCGDSRLYWMRDGQILARTRDHSHVENLIAKGWRCRPSAPPIRTATSCGTASAPTACRA
jgi:hypothetical protein